MAAPNLPEYYSYDIKNEKDEICVHIAEVNDETSALVCTWCLIVIVAEAVKVG